MDRRRLRDRAEGRLNEVAFPGPGGVPSRSSRIRGRAVDAAVAGAVLLLGWALTDKVGLSGPLPAVLGGLPVLPHVVIAVGLLVFRRSRPLIPTALTLLAAGVALLGPVGLSYAGLGASVYACAVYRSTRSGVTGAVLGAVLFAVVECVEHATGIAAYRDVAGALGAVAVLSAPGAALAAIAVLLGLSVRNRRRHVAVLVERADRLARERDQQARLAVVAERGRIARELHDMVAHSLSVMVRLSDGADAIAGTDPERARETVRHIGRVGRESLVDMRRLLNVLHDEEDPAALAPQPSSEDVAAMLATARAAGLPVASELGDMTALDAATQLVVFRVLQEGVTNALRYAVAPTRVLVRLQVEDAVQLEVSDDGRARAPRASVGAGRGLIGIRERAALYGGEVEAGPRPELGGHGWRLRVTLPLSSSSGRREGARP